MRIGHDVEMDDFYAGGSGNSGNDTKPTAPKPAPEEEAPPPRDPSILHSSSTDELSALFKTLVEKRREGLNEFRPALSQLNMIVVKFQDIGLDRIGLEHMDYDTFREYNMVRKSGSNQVDDSDATYCMLSIYDARFLLRVHTSGVVDCHADNMAKPSPELRRFDMSNFWYTGEKPRHFQYDLNDEEKRVGLMNTILQTAATCAANAELKDLNVAQRNGTSISKSLPKRSL